MAYTELKEKLEQLLNEDISNRSTIQEARRNLFLSSEGSKVQQQLIEQKQGEIASLNTLVEKKKTIVQLKEDEIAVLKNTLKDLEEKVLTAEIALEEERKVFGAKVAEMNASVEASADLENKLTGLSLQNEEYAAKIRELIHHIDAQNSEMEGLKLELNAVNEAKAEIEALKNELASVRESASVDSKQLVDKVAEIESLNNELNTLKATPVVDTSLMEEKTAEIERLQEKSDLLSESEQQLKVLVSSQNNEIENLTKQNNGYKKQVEDIAAGWQHQQEQLLADNSNLLAELAMLKETMVVTETPVSTVSPELVATIEAEKEQLNTQLQAATAELTTIKETISHTPAPTTTATQSEVDELRLEKERIATELLAVKHELEMTIQKREEKIILLQAEVGTLQNQVIALSDSLNQEADTNGLMGTQLEQLKSITAEKEQKLNEMANNKSDDEFIDKLIFQANRLNDEKHRLELLYSESEAELTLARTNLAALTQLVEAQKTSISGLDETGKHVKLAQTLMLQADEKTAAKQAINELVREIDRCIALLSE